MPANVSTTDRRWQPDFFFCPAVKPAPDAILASARLRSGRLWHSDQRSGLRIYAFLAFLGCAERQVTPAGSLDAPPPASKLDWETDASRHHGAATHARIRRVISEYRLDGWCIIKVCIRWAFTRALHLLGAGVYHDWSEQHYSSVGAGGDVGLETLI